MRMTTCLAHLAFASFLISPSYAQDPEAATDAPTVAEAMANEPVATGIAEEAVDAKPADAAEAAEAAESPESPPAVDTDTDASATDEATAAAPAAAIASAITIPAPPAGKGQVVFFREKKFAGSAVRFKVRENDQELGKLGSGIYFVHVTEPGVHEYVVHSEAKDALTLEVEDGETYFVAGSITMGLMVGRPNLSPADEIAFAAASEKLSPAKE